MFITEIYTKFQVPKNLQEHMLRVSALAKIMTENWVGQPIHKPAIVEACLIHDLAKPMIFDLSKQAKFGMTETERELLHQWQVELKKRYGSEEHPAAVKILKEIGGQKLAIRLLNNLEWYYLERFMKLFDFESLIPIYCDMRIGPWGILTLEVRVTDLQTRASIKNFEQFITEGKAVEKLLQQFIRRDLNTITDNDLIQLFDKLSLVQIG